MTSQITIRGARLHNLKNISLSIPKNQLVVLTGLSGSGKSTLGFDILHKEGQRQYLESLGMVGLWAGEAAGRCHQRAFPIHQRGPAPHQPQPALHGGHRHRCLYLPAGAVCPPGSPPLPGLRQRRPALLLIPPARTGRVNPAWRRRSAPGRNLPLPALRRAGPRDEHGPLSPSTSPPGPARPAPGWAAVHQANLKRLVDEEKSIPEGAVTGWNATSTSSYHTANPAGRRRPLRVRLRPLAAGQRLSPRRSATCCSLAWKAPSSAATFPEIEPPATVRQGRFEGRRHQPAAPLRRTHPGTPITATSWKNSWSPRPAPTAPAHACAPKAGR